MTTKHSTHSSPRQQKCWQGEHARPLCCVWRNKQRAMGPAQGRVCATDHSMCAVAAPQNTGVPPSTNSTPPISGKLSKSVNTVQCDATSYQVAAYVTGNINGNKNRGVNTRIQDCFCMAHVAVGAHQCLLHSAWGLNNYLSTTAQRLSQAGIDPTAAQLPQQRGLWV
jgi:hypothetical protein